MATNTTNPTATTSPQGRPSFFDDDDLEIKFDWEKLEKTRYSGILQHTPLQSETWTRTLANSQTTVQAFFCLYPRVIVQFKV